jgi:Bax protein
VRLCDFVGLSPFFDFMTENLIKSSRLSRAEELCITLAGRTMNILSQSRLLSVSLIMLIAIPFSQPCSSQDNENILLPPLEEATSNPLTSLPDFSAMVDVKQKKQTFFALIYPIVQKENAHILLPPLEEATSNPLTSLPDFSAMVDVKHKKQTFFALIYPIVQQENAHILLLREGIARLYEKDATELSTSETLWLLGLGEHYQLPHKEVNATLFDYLMRRVDFIPPSLALSQAAIESGWGTSRFSTSANNLFGLWCFDPGCGLVPISREEGKDHEVATFDTVNDSVRFYLHSLNTRQPYAQFRQVREDTRQNGEPLSGLELAEGLTQYSAEGEEYVTKLSQFISQNKLQRFTQSQP